MDAHVYFPFLWFIFLVSVCRLYMTTCLSDFLSHFLVKESGNAMILCSTPTPSIPSLVLSLLVTVTFFLSVI